MPDFLDIARCGERTLVMGILNVTPDSFSDGGRYLSLDDAIRRGEAMARDGADLIDIGGESTRPGATPVCEDEELARVVPVVAALAERFDVPISVDTMKARVAREAVRAGASLVNDVSGMTVDAAMPGTVAELGVAVCLMHMKGEPRTMQERPEYGDVVLEVRDWLRERAEAAIRAGVDARRIIVDPGFGFGKTPEHNLALVRHLGAFADLGYPVLLGVSRKSTIGAVLGGLPVEERLEGTAAAVAIGIANGAAIVRVHDVREMVRVVRVADAIVRGA